MIDVLAITLLLAANGFFVAAEFALVKARGFRVESLAAEGRIGAALTLRIQRDIESYLAACQLGITMASLGLGWVGEPAVEALLHPLFEAGSLSPDTTQTVSFLVGFVLFSSLHIVVGEQVPKTLAIREPEPVSLWCAYPLRAFFILAYPLNRALSAATSAILKLFGVQQATHAEVLSAEELGALAAQSGEHGSIAQEKADMVANLFAFDLRPVSRVMIPRGNVVMLDATAPGEVNIAKMAQTNHSRFPLFIDDANRPRGTVLSKDVYAAALQSGEEVWGRLADFVREPVVVPETLLLPQLFDTMRARRTHMAYVVDEYGEFVGLVTLEDLLEEIVGDIADETDAPGNASALLARDGGWETDGLTTLADLSRELGLSVSAELDANTLSGLLMQRLARMPEVDDEIEENGYRVKVLDMHDNHVGRVFIERLTTAPTSTHEASSPDHTSADEDAPESRS